MRLLLAASIALLLAPASLALAEEKEKKEETAGGTPFEVADGKLAFTAPKGWEKKEPRSRIIEVEFAIPAVKEDKEAGRFTVMGAGGDVQANIDRWFGQFEGSDDKEKGKVEKMTVAGNEVHYVDLAGTYKDSPSGPFAKGKTILREDYRMLAAIIQTEEAGNYFLKFYGPQETVSENEEQFKELIKSLKVK